MPFVPRTPQPVGQTALLNNRLLILANICVRGALAIFR